MPPTLLLFLRNGAHRALHPFPTRRSSDLRGAGGEGRTPRILEGPSPHPRPLSPQAGRDRKSTRLNSSHRTISYAVFCLKKKTTKNSSRSHSVRVPRTLTTRTIACAPSSGT